MADQGQESEGARDRGGGLVAGINRYMDYGWEHAKMLIAALLVFIVSDVFKFMLFLYLGFYFGNLSVREVDGSTAQFAIYATLTVIAVLGVYLILGKMFRRR
jgi:hypothetical protein